MAIEPKTKQDQEKMGVALQRLAEEDPTFHVFTNEDTGQTIIAGMGELHLEIIRDRMFREFKVDANAGKPQIAYRETITAPARWRRQAHQAVRWSRSIRPRHRQGAAERARQRHRDREQGRRRHIPKEYIPACKKGIEEAMLNGVVGGYQVIDVECRHRRWLVSRRRFERNRLQDGGHFRGQGCVQEGEADPARADHEGREHRRRKNIRATSWAT